ncbi:Uncharacterised protein [Mycobacterium tuberculosis]|nr:Uncharacterised protein [Mycobacterium tuberculosis]
MKFFTNSGVMSSSANTTRVAVVPTVIDFFDGAATAAGWETES